MYPNVPWSQCDPREVDTSGGVNPYPDQTHYVVVSVESQTEIDRKKQGMLLTLSPTRTPQQNIPTPDPDGEESGRYTYAVVPSNTPSNK